MEHVLDAADHEPLQVAARRLRNSLSHPSMQNIWSPAMAAPAIVQAHRIVAIVGVEAAAWQFPRGGPQTGRGWCPGGLSAAGAATSLRGSPRRWRRGTRPGVARQSLSWSGRGHDGSRVGMR